MKNVRFLGLDVHAEAIAVAVAEPGGEVRSLGVIPDRPESVRRLMGKLGKSQQLRVCYEAGPTGYVLYWQLTQLGIHCDVVAPTLVPVKAGPRQLPTNHDHDGGPCARSTNIRVINRRSALPRLLFPCAWAQTKRESS